MVSIRSILIIVGISSSLSIPASAQQPFRGFDATQLLPGGVAELTLDADGDGLPDILSLSIAPTLQFLTSLSLQRNLGGGVFSTAWTTQGPAQPGLTNLYAHAQVANLDSAGSPDFLVHTQFAVMVFLSNGLALPTPFQVFAGGFFIDRVMPMDLTGDGIDELVVSDFNGNLTFISFNAASGTATSAVNNHGLSTRFSAIAPTLPGSWAIPIVDASNNLTVLTITSLGAITNTASLGSVLPGLRHIAEGDVDGDGDQDFVLFATGSLYQVLRQGAPGVFALETLVIGGPASRLIDIDGDGDLDAVGATINGAQPLSQWVDFQTSSMEISWNDGSGSFSLATRIPSIGGNGYAPVADFNGDGILDIAGGRGIYFSPRVLSGPPFVSFAPQPTSDPRISLARDLEGDGDVDLEVSPLQSFINDGSGRFLPMMSSVAGLSAATIDGYSPIDHDGDGDTDFLVRAPMGTPVASQSLYVLTQVAPYQFVAGPAMASVGTLHLAPDAILRSYDVDMDNDGRRDLVLTTELPLSAPAQPDRTTIYRNLGGGVFAPPVSFNLTLKGIGDFNQDGLPDTVVHNAQAGFAWQLLWSRNLGGMNFTLPTPLGVGFSQHQYRNVVVRDLDQDGIPDILSPNIPQGIGTLRSVTALINSGAGTFTALPNLMTTISPQYVGQLVAADLDLDGIADYFERFTSLLGVSSVPNDRLYFGLGGGLHGSAIEYVLPASVIADVNGDGPMDVVSLSLGFTHTFLFAASALGGSYSQFGISGFGSGGAIPVLGASGPFRANNTVTAHLRGGLGGASALFGISAAALPSPTLLAPGHELYLDLSVQPSILLPLQLTGSTGTPGVGSFTLPFFIPPGFQGVTLFHHSAFADASVPGGIATSNAFVITFGG